MYLHSSQIINGHISLIIFGISVLLLAQVLRIHLSSEDDVFFLHTLEVSEEDFQALKVEQGILVDFGNFPAKIISLMERCSASAHEEPPRYWNSLLASAFADFLPSSHMLMISLRSLQVPGSAAG